MGSYEHRLRRLEQVMDPESWFPAERAEAVINALPGLRHYAYEFGPPEPGDPWAPGGELDVLYWEVFDEHGMQRTRARA